MLDLVPEGFEEDDADDGLELTAYTDAAGEDRLRRAFDGVRATDVADGWEERWREHHRPVRVGGLWIGPPWHPPPTGVPVVVIDPGLAFGTGAHATTRLCIALLARVDRGSMLDLGCGSGVLAIAAARLGFAPVTAVDNDPRAIEAAKRNARANSVQVETRLADVLEHALPPTDVTVANLTLGLVERVGQCLASTIVITSGYLAGERPTLAGYRRVERRTGDGWAADVFERSQ